MSPLLRGNELLTPRPRKPEDTAALARRSRRVALAKMLLPVAGALLLAVLAMAPGWHLGEDSNRVSYHVQPNAGPPAPSKLEGASYHGTDQQGQPYTLTATTAVEKDANDVALTAPIGDITLNSGAWLMLKSTTGLYHQVSGTLGLDGDVTLYRNDGTVMTTPDADIDLHAGTASGAGLVQVQGPFGTLTAQNGFTLLNRGAEITFIGPATLMLTQAQ